MQGVTLLLVLLVTLVLVLGSRDERLVDDAARQVEEVARAQRELVDRLAQVGLRKFRRLIRRRRRRRTLFGFFRSNRL